MKIGINNPGKKQLIISVQLLFILKWMSKNIKVVGPFLQTSIMIREER